MAIKWNEDLQDYKTPYNYDTQRHSLHENAGKVTDAGMVMLIQKSYGSEWAGDYTYAVVWNPETQLVEHRTLSSMYGGFGSEQVVRYGTAEVDMDPVMRAKVEAILRQREKESHDRKWLEDNLEHALKVAKGKTVEVYKGRKVAKGTRGIVKWYGTDSYGADKVGLKVEGVDKLVYTAADNVKVVFPSDWDPTIPYWLMGE